MLAWLSQWNNWPFLLSLLVGMGLVGLTLLGFSKDVDHGVDLDHDGVPDVQKPEGDQFLNWFSVLGVGKVPVSVLLEVLLVSFGLIGLLVNAVANDLLASWGTLLFPVAFVGALVGSAVATRMVADLIAKFAPADAPTSRRPGEFAGSIGTAITLITSTIGQVRVVSPDAPDAYLNVCLDPTLENPCIVRGTEVYLVSYDPAKSLYRVRPTSTLK